MIVVVEPSIAVTVNGAAWVVAANVSSRPAGALAIVISTVRGSSLTHLGGGQTLRVRRGQRQLEVRRIVVVGRVEGPGRHASERVLRVGMAGRRAVLEDERPGQPGRGERSVLRIAAEPEKFRSARPRPTSSQELGVEMVGTGGALAVAVTLISASSTRSATACRSPSSLTVSLPRLRVGERRRRARRVVVAVVRRSPTRRSAGRSPGRWTPVPSNGTVSGAAPGVGLAGSPRSAAGSRRCAAMRRIVPPSKST